LTQPKFSSCRESCLFAVEHKLKRNLSGVADPPST
jgi:hypothetical protein